jgi:hypothetical protein
VTVSRRAAEDGHDYLGAKPPDYPNDILENRVARPMGPGFVERLGEAEIVRPGEELSCSVQAPGRQQLLGPQQPERLAQFGPDGVLSAFAPIERQIGGLGALTSDQHGEQLGVLVVGVRPDDEYALVVAQQTTLVLQCNDPAGGGRLELSGERNCDDN